VKYYLERNIDGFGNIDAIMHDPNIEDVSSLVVHWLVIHLAMRVTPV